MKASYLVGGLATATSLADKVVNANILFGHQSGMHIGLRDIHHSSSLERRDAIAREFNGWGTFDQLLDHAKPELGTFQQRFWYGTEYWKGPGSPIIVVNAGETSADYFNLTYTTNYTLPGRYAEENGAAVVIVEHRYWGKSSPFDVLTVQNLTYLTLENSLQDMIYFAKNFVPPFDASGNSSSTNAPYIYLGGSYPGAIAHWLATLYPGEGFWAYHAVSAVVQAVGDFHNYWDPVFEYLPKNCSKDVTKVIDHIDKILLYGTGEEIVALKTKFGFDDTADVDFAWALATPFVYFQSNMFTDRINTVDFFCGFIETPSGDGQIPGADGVGLEKALSGFAEYFRYELMGTCSGLYAAWEGTHYCWDTQDVFGLRYTDLSVDNLVNRQWLWLLCNEPFEWWQTGTPRPIPTPEGTNGIISRLLNYDTMRTRCFRHFPPPPGFEALHTLPDQDSHSNNPNPSRRSTERHLSPTANILQGKTAQNVNDFTNGGWNNINSPTKRLMHSNGDSDPWRDATLASHVRPGGPLKSTPDLPHFVIPGGTHCKDLMAANWIINQDVARIVDAECEILGRWIGEFYEQKGKTWPLKMKGGNGNATEEKTVFEVAKRKRRGTKRADIEGRRLQQ